ncbi:hypothetical protein JKP88DRAFT_214431 [Tribonema minus]|uniref:Histone deacetylase n=1 Tax=Tribonema minus TaxID=303371 RepID=A0A836CPT1_9STRA|nr:hypothetical protein JKP88DRAFT_214431 [Tribonema minus]
MAALANSGGSAKKRVAYFYDADVGGFSYGSNTVFKPHRVRMTHNLVLSYGLFEKMDVYRAPPASSAQMQAFHTESYLKFFASVTPESHQVLKREEMLLLNAYGLGDEQPVFHEMYNYASAVAGASLSGAALLNAGKADIAINWSGGMHHAKKSKASGFCYINDCVLAIVELLKTHARVLYIDIDVHHGDGVEEAFYSTNRVMTLSFHHFAERFFPGSGGSMEDTGDGAGKHCALNFPLKAGMDDISYASVFQPAVAAAMTHYQPGAIVLQMGADSLAGDRLGRAGHFNVSMKCHAECALYVRSLGVPLLVLGGGGYTLSNVPRCWANDTAALTDTALPRAIPETCAYRSYYGPDFAVTVGAAARQRNANSPSYLQRVLQRLVASMRAAGAAAGLAAAKGAAHAALLGAPLPPPLKAGVLSDEQLDEDPDRRPPDGPACDAGKPPAVADAQPMQVDQ